MDKIWISQILLLLEPHYNKKKWNFNKIDILILL